MSACPSVVAVPPIYRCINSVALSARPLLARVGDTAKWNLPMRNGGQTWFVRNGRAGYV